VTVTKSIIKDEIISDGNWTTWSNWTSCSVTCGNGTQSRMRQCANPTPSNGGTTCIGDDAQQQTCSLPICAASK